MTSLDHERPSRLDVLMGVAQLMASRGTCSRLQVGALVHREGRILVTGYNGAPAGLAHCDHSCNCDLGPSDRGMDHREQCRVVMPCSVTQHAERNCIDWAAREGIRLMNGMMVTTDTPCAQCAGSIINAGIVSVIALRSYRDPTGSAMLAQAGISLVLHKDAIG